ncbi:HAD family hydrolase [Vibrio marisflavi]|uniref:Phosphorylated carbohydrates phosphatase n=1 Tax=Vibrio marisflavi CECT 7928 TaxID=634439 RepID=A0ABN8E4F2_9VIBR|nr:HAD family phosphatase [Vibrio marisflavi]CAH0540344.1 Phosphorylated carbohydrates phosphatase [Vibrio marisflavi CECT 7928]
MREYEAYLFDMDGTLVNSEPLKGKALALACKQYDASVDYQIYKDVMGQEWSQVTNHFFQSANISPNREEFNTHFREYYQELLQSHLVLNQGARKYIESLKKAGKKCAVVSSAAKWMIESILTQLEITSLFDAVVGKEDVSAHKPNPEAYNLAVSKLNVTPFQSVIFEDSTVGVKAGVASGNDVIAIRHEFNQNHDLSSALLIIDDFSQL